MKKIIRSYREKLGFTQAELAEKTSLSIRTIQRVESGKTVPKGYTLKVLSEVFGVEKEELVAQKSTLKTEESKSNVNLKLINLSALGFIGIPFGNLIFPFMIWNKYREDETVNEVGSRIINFQIIWTFCTCLLLIISPFLQDYFPSDFILILNVGLLAMVVNICVILKTAIDLNASKYDVLLLKLRLL
ncbi:MAG: helix-turn-helix domain-containing protein [Saprospiraceae bacterium]